MRFIGGAVTGVLAVPALLVGWLAWMDRRSDHRHALMMAEREDASYCGEAVSSPRPAVAVSGLREALDASARVPRSGSRMTQDGITPGYDGPPRSVSPPPRPPGKMYGVEPRVPRDRPGPGLRT